MNAWLRSILTVVLICGIPAATLAQNHGGQPSGGGRPSGGSVAAPPRAPAPPPPSHNEPGFSFPRDDMNPAPPPRPIEHPVAPVAPPPERPVARPEHPTTGANRGSERYTQAPLYGGERGGPYHGTFRGPVIGNPHRWQPWQWNRGVIWYPAPIYWGGGFWGPFVWGYPGIIFLGSIVDYQDQVIYPSYQIVASSPGAQLLENYGLTQAQCGPPGLVVIWGPGDSVICAYPNDTVAPGNYELDPSTLTITAKD